MEKKEKSESIRGARIFGLWHKDILVATFSVKGRQRFMRIVRYLTDEELKKEHCPPFAKVIGRKRRRRIYWAYCKAAR